MSALLDRERALYTDIWSIPSYGDHSPGASFVPLFLEMAQIDRGATRMQTVLDAGCGSGKGALALAAEGFRVTLADLTADGLIAEARDLPFYQVCLWHDLGQQSGYHFGGKVDHVYCCDVLEHIPTEFTMLVIRRLLDVARRGVFLSISLVPDRFGVWVGQPLHHTVQSFVWWKDRLASLGVVREARDLIDTGLYYVEPR